MRRAGVAAIGTALAAALVGVAVAIAQAAPGVVASRVPVTISASSVDVGRLVYEDTVAVETAGDAVPTLRLVLDAATFHGLRLDLPCVPVQLGGLTGRTATGTTTAPSLTVYATEVVATIGGNRVRISSTDPAYPPPPAGTTLVADGTLGDPVIVSLMAVAPSLHTAASTTSASFCTPGGGPAVTGGSPLQLNPPSPSASEPPAEEPATEPAPEPGDSTPAEPGETPSSPAPEASEPPQPTPTPTPETPPPPEPAAPTSPEPTP